MSKSNVSRATQSVVRDGDRWSDAACWEGGRYRRESFFFPSGDDRLYGSLYVATAAFRQFGVVVCPSWGMEGRFLLEWCHQLALGAADVGGASLVVQWPGPQDSGFVDRELLDGAGTTDDPLAAGVLDSLAIEQLTAFVEKRFGVAFDEEELDTENFRSIDVLAAFVDAKRAAS